MLSILGRGSRLCDGITRREVMRVGALAFGGLTLADLLRLRAEAAPGSGAAKSVIMIWLRGGPSHIDSYDMKPDAPDEIRGEFRPIPTVVGGIQVCEHLPRTARMMDKLAILRGIRSDTTGGYPTGAPYTPGNVLASLYRRLGIDTDLEIPDREGRPMRVLESEPVREL